MNIFTVLNDLVTLIIAVVVCFIVYRQYRNDIRATRLSLYEKRYKFYVEVRDFLHEIVNNPAPTVKMPDIRECYFIFEKEDVYDYMYGLSRDILKYGRLCNEIEREKTAGNTKDGWVFTEVKWVEKIKEKNRYEERFFHEYVTIEERFMKYLDFRKAEPQTIEINNIWLGFRMFFQRVTNKLQLFGLKLIAPFLWLGHKVFNKNDKS